jgi:hypothetical protein
LKVNELSFHFTGLVKEEHINPQISIKSMSKALRSIPSPTLLRHTYKRLRIRRDTEKKTDKKDW